MFQPLVFPTPNIIYIKQVKVSLQYEMELGR